MQRVEETLQRLFSNFASGLPGVGLLLLRLATAAALLHCELAQFKTAPQFALIVPQVIGAVAGKFLLVGLWTPAAGMVVASAELWITFSRGGHPWSSLLLAALGASLAMIGPGACSVDARLFGRKHIEVSSR
jgi:putative oxidoreductase